MARKANHPNTEPELNTEALRLYLESHGVTDEQTSFELAQDLEPIIRRLVWAHRNVVTK
jgi:hypothetical protein